MDPISVGLMAYGAIDSLLSKDDDPYAAQRKEIQKALAELNSGKMANAIKLRGALKRSEATRMLMDKSAAAGIPQNVTNQSLLDASVATGRETEEALAANEQNVLSQKARLLGMLPPEPEDNTGAQLLSLGIQGATTGAFKDLLGKNPTGPIPGSAPGAERMLLSNGQYAVTPSTGGPNPTLSMKMADGSTVVPINSGHGSAANPTPAYHNANTILGKLAYAPWKQSEKEQNDWILKLLLGQ